MNKTHIYAATGVALLVSVIGFVSISSAPTPHSSLLVESETQGVTPESDVDVDTPAKKLLSDDAEYPTPVVQLQQTLTYGLVNADAPSLPILKGDLESFAQSNIDDSQQVPDELANLKARLDALKQISNSQ
ncbi:hypothetical protein [Grimontia marina]|uniref:Uncharacterized protein n=1 Tax=Grimontia marina TaxID=646534 RepID=A0A128FK65_9GAMM|nr:hypothetical protein [Grimontia marina]CZF86684.1 hypothetical protein GMA8713_04722 [Grimontia marina]